MTIRCRVCARVLAKVEDGLAVWASHPGLLPNEGSGLCPTCSDELEASHERNRKLADRLARASRRRGDKFGPAPAGVDPFASLVGGCDGTGRLPARGDAATGPQPSFSIKGGK
jgi:hypothetical protein